MVFGGRGRALVPQGRDAGNVNGSAALAAALLEGCGTSINQQEGLPLLRFAAASSLALTAGSLQTSTICASALRPWRPEARRW
jgi:hypothetical protein